MPPGRDSETAVARIEMDLRERVPRGAIVTPGGERRAFGGWTELASAIEEWRAAARSAQGSGDGAPTSGDEGDA
jgi:hypothetical protein